MTAPTLAGRIAAGAAVGRQIMGRTGALFAVAQQAAAVEPLIAAAWQEGREQTRHAQEVFCTKLADDGLLPPGIDLTWLIDTTTVLVAAETYLLVTRMLGWDLDSYEAWIAATLTRLLTGPGGIPALPDPELVDERPVEHPDLAARGHDAAGLGADRDGDGDRVPRRVDPVHQAGVRLGHPQRAGSRRHVGGRCPQRHGRLHRAVAGRDKGQEVRVQRRGHRSVASQRHEG
jgi:hypothetical protein